MSVVPELLAANERYAEGFTKGDLPSPPARRAAILTCMDARLLPDRILGLEEGDARVIRNAGGRASPDAIRSLIVSYKKLGTNEILVIHHTDCGMLGLDDEEFRRELLRDTGGDASTIDFLGFSDLQASVRQDGDTIRDCPLIPDEIPVKGYVFDVRTGRLREVD